MVLDEIAHIDFTEFSWKKDLLRSKPPMNSTEGRILPVLANAIAAFPRAGMGRRACVLRIRFRYKTNAVGNCAQGRVDRS